MKMFALLVLVSWLGMWRFPAVPPSFLYKRESASYNQSQTICRWATTLRRLGQTTMQWGRQLVPALQSWPSSWTQSLYVVMSSPSSMLLQSASLMTPGLSEMVRSVGFRIWVIYCYCHYWLIAWSLVTKEPCRWFTVLNIQTHCFRLTVLRFSLILQKLQYCWILARALFSKAHTAPLTQTLRTTATNVELFLICHTRQDHP